MNVYHIQTITRLFLCIIIVQSLFLILVPVSGDRLPPDIPDVRIDDVFPDNPDPAPSQNGYSDISQTPVTRYIDTLLLPGQNLVFIPNDNITASYVDFYVRSGNKIFFFTDERIILTIDGRIEKTLELDAVFPGITGPVQIEPENILPGTVQFFTGMKVSHWKSNIPTYGSILYRDIYPGIHMAITGEGGILEVELSASPSADKNHLFRAYDGMGQIQQFLSSEKNNLLSEEPKNGILPLVCLTVNDNPNLSPGFEDSLSIEEFDTGHILKTGNLSTNLSHLLACTYYGGTFEETDTNIAVDPDGNVYITGKTSSLNLPMSSESIYPGYEGGSYDVFVTKFNPNLSQILYTTYLGGENEDVGSGIVVDDEGCAYVTGYTLSTEFPTTPGALQEKFGGTGNGVNSDGGDVFVTKLSPDGKSLVYSTYIGGYLNDRGDGITIDKEKNVYITGISYSPDFPVSPWAYQKTQAGQGDIIICKLNPSGNALTYATLIGGNQAETGYDIVVDNDGNATIIGVTWNGQFPTTSRSFQPLFGGGMYDGIVVKINTDGSDCIYASYLGGNSQDVGYGITTDSVGNAYIAGFTESQDFPLTPGAFQVQNNGQADAFLTIISPDGERIIASTEIGGDRYDRAEALTLDSSGFIYLTGSTNSPDFPITPDAYQKKNIGDSNMFLTVFDPSCTTILYSSCLGGTGTDSPAGIAIDSSKKVYISGRSTSQDIPVTERAFQGSNNGSTDSVIFVFGNMTLSPPDNAYGKLLTLNQDLADENGIQKENSYHPPSLFEVIWNYCYQSFQEYFSLLRVCLYK